MDAKELGQRKELARVLLSAERVEPGEPEAIDEPAENLRLAAAAMLPLTSPLSYERAEEIPFPAGLAPVPQAPTERDPEAPLPEGDVLVITWTAAEADALADVFTPGFPRRCWHWYRHRVDDHFETLIRAGAPAKLVSRLGSWLKVQIGGQSVICFKSELHLNQDGIRTATLPTKDLLLQLIAEVKPALVLTVGTAGGGSAPQACSRRSRPSQKEVNRRNEFPEQISSPSSSP